MAANISTREPTRGGDQQDPAVVNVRRPYSLRQDTSPRAGGPHADLGGVDDAPRPLTMLRLPDLAAIVKSLPKRQLNYGAIAQWAAIGLGGLLALWLIFGGGRAPVREVKEAPPWSPPSSAAAPPAWPATQEASPAGPAGPPAGGQPHSGAERAPDWNDPNWNESAQRAAPPADGPQAVRTAQRGQPSPASGRPGEAQPLGITVPVRQ